MQEDKIVKIFRYLAIFLVLATIVYLAWMPDGSLKWFGALAVWFSFILAVLVRNYYVYRRMHRNFSLVAGMASKQARRAA